MHARSAAVAALAAAAVVVVAPALTRSGLAQEEDRRPVGALRSHRSEQTFDLSIGITAAGRPRLPEKVRDDRVHVVVPSHYGDLFQVTQSGDDAVLWYRASDGAVRNAVLTDTATVAYQVERRDSAEFDVKLR